MSELAPRIVSLLPAATEMAFALGLGECVIGVSHECDFPLSARQRPIVVRPALALESLSQREIDSAVSRRIASGGSLYQIDEQLLQELRPNLILTQDLCQVCAPSGRELGATLQSLRPAPRVLALSPHTLAEVLENVRELGRLTDRLAEAQRLVDSWNRRLAAVRAALATEAARPRVIFMEWIDPIYCAGHWIPEMIELAGGSELLGHRGGHSARISWQQLRSANPDVLLVAPCGCSLDQALAQVSLLQGLPGWAALSASHEGRVYCLDANAYFARPGPRLIDGIELLAHVLHAERIGWRGPQNAYRALQRVR